MAPSPTGGSGNAVRGVAISYGDRHTFSGEPTCSASSKVAPTEDGDVHFEAEAYGEKYVSVTTLEPVI